MICLLIAALCFTGGLGVGLVLGRANGYKEAIRARRRYYGLGEEGDEFSPAGNALSLELGVSIGSGSF